VKIGLCTMYFMKPLLTLSGPSDLDPEENPDEQA